MDIRLIISDVDGVWTDGGMYYLNNGVEAKKFTTSDSVGIALAKLAQIPVAVISGEDIPALRLRMEKLKIEHFYPGTKNKVALARQLAGELGITLQQVAFVGDEVNDHNLLKAVGFSGCPASAPAYTQEIVNYVTPTPGGLGAFRDFVMEILRKQNRLEETFRALTESYLS
jgi:3-deoxy-D-manno-octulosonate 8-phosphate phosphatase (KDO 8-P phosphatase)